MVSHRGIKESSKTCASLDRALVDALSKRLKTIHVYHCCGHCDHHTKDSWGQAANTTEFDLKKKREYEWIDRKKYLRLKVQNLFGRKETVF